MSEFGSFFLPGPTEVRPAVLAAMTGAMIAHRGRAFEDLYRRVQTGLREVFRTSRPVFVSSSSATGLMEAALRCAPAGPVLALTNGGFADRFAQIARACQRDTDILAAAWGATFDPAQVEAQLRRRRYAAMTVVHSETSTGALTDVRTLTHLARQHGALCVIDSVTGVAGAPLEFDAWELDFVLTGSQKALALPPGLAFCAASEHYMRRARQSSGRGLYFDLVEFEEYAARDQTPNTPALSLMYALDVQLEAVRAEGMERRWARHASMRHEAERWVAALRAHLGDELDIVAPLGARSPTITAVALPRRIRPTDVLAGTLARGITIGSGYGRLRETTVRIGHMGDHTLSGLQRCLAACEAALIAADPTRP
ncbi:MAG: alanine--glyoxylate aminotransferase family protein [Gemmatimonadaceae bacterium]